MMATVPEDADIEELLILRHRLLKKLSASNRSTADLSNARKECRHRPENSEQQSNVTGKLEKRLSLVNSVKCSRQVIPKLSTLGHSNRTEPGGSSFEEKRIQSSDLVAEHPVDSVVNSWNAGKCPFQQTDDVSVDNRLKKSKLHQKVLGTVSPETPKLEDLYKKNLDVSVNDEVKEVQRNNVHSTVEGSSQIPFIYDEEGNGALSLQTENTVLLAGNNGKKCGVAIIPEEPSPLPSKLSLTTTLAQKSDLENGTDLAPILQQFERTEEQSTSLQPGVGSGSSETSESVQRSMKDEKDVFLSDDDDDEDIDLLLEKPLEDAQTSKAILPEEGEVREKVVLAFRGTDYFDVLPEGWVEVTHNSGLPIYLHKSTRVCTFSRPYFIGPGSVRHHNVPISAIPCLHQRRVLKEVEEGAAASAAALQNALAGSEAAKGDNGRNEDSALVVARLQAPGTKVQTAEDFKERHLDAEALHDYAKAVFKFKKIQTYRFNKWAATRNFHRQRKLAEAGRLGKTTSSIELSVGRPSLPSNVKLITVPALEANLKPQHRGFFLNPQGKTSVSVLHEYVQKVLKSTINYHFSETRNSSMPYGCTARLKMNLNSRVLCATSVKEKLMLLQEKQKREQRLQENGEQPDADFVVLGMGCGNSKKTAKLGAARNALKVLIPDIEFDAEGIAVSDKKEKDDTESDKEDAIALFDMLPIEDSRIFDLSARAGQPSPYLLLQECLKRNAAYGDTEIRLHSVRVKHQRHQFDMHVGKHRVSVICTNKREGKQKASQAMLKKLHPNLDTWGSLIRLYGYETQQKLQEARKSRQSIIKLQGNRDKEKSVLEPNGAILDKLRMEMLKLARSKQQEGETPVPKRPKLSATNEPVDDLDAARCSAEYASTHPDALSALRIDL